MGKICEKWCTTIRVEEGSKRIFAYQANEEHAAYEANLLNIQNNNLVYNTNDVDEPRNFKQYKAKKTHPNRKKRVPRIKDNTRVRNSAGDSVIIIKNIKNQEIKEVLIDDDDYDNVNKYNWTLKANGYAFTTVTNLDGSTRCISMHRFIKNVLDEGHHLVDHANGNRLDNRKANLRLATVQQNSLNRKKNKGSSSKYFGVSWDNTFKKWKVEKVIKKIRYHIGYYDDEVEAAKAYDTFVRNQFSSADLEFVNTNFPEDNDNDHDNDDEDDDDNDDNDDDDDDDDDDDENENDDYFNNSKKRNSNDSCSDRIDMSNSSKRFMITRSTAQESKVLIAIETKFSDSDEEVNF